MSSSFEIIIVILELKENDFVIPYNISNYKVIKI